MVSIYIRLTLTAIVLLAALVGNLIVLRVVCSKNPRRKPLVYMLVGNLAVAELGQTILQPFLLYYEETWQWVYGDFLCRVMYPLQAMCWASITMTLAAIAVYRYLVIISPLYMTRVSAMKLKLLLVSFWCVGLAISLPSAVTREVFPCHRRPNNTCCGEVFRNPSAQRKYAVAFDVVVNLIPMITMTVAYALVGLKLRWHLRSMRRTQNCRLNSIPLQKVVPLAVNTNNSKNNNINRGNPVRNVRNEGTIVELEKKLLKMMYFIVISFIICYTPYEVMNHLFQNGILQSWRYGGIVAMYALWLILVPSALHPIFYGTRSKLLGKNVFMR